MATLAVVSDYVTEARVLLLDQLPPYRYLDNELLTGLNMSLLEARKLRPDLFLTTTPIGSVPSFSAVDSTAVPMDPQYAVALVYYVAGNAQMRDEESTQDSRAGAFMAMFKQSLVGM